MDNKEVKGPAMLSMTSALRPPPARISRIGDNITLPFSVQIDQLVATSVGGLTGLIIAVMFFAPFIGGSITLFGAGLMVGGFIGLLFVTWSPLRGEKLSTWLGLSVKQNRKTKVEIDGVQVKAFVGVAELSFSAAGEIRIISGAVNVPAGSVDERGVFLQRDRKQYITEENRAL
ncbi:MAG: hypothetical protein ACKOW9_04990 [Candidatus Paceibacterota bacterium]